MRKIERIEQGGSITVVHTEQIDQLESTIDELVGMLVEFEKIHTEYAYGHQNHYHASVNLHKQVKYKLEILTGKTWDNLKELTND